MKANDFLVSAITLEDGHICYNIKGAWYILTNNYRLEFASYLSDPHNPNMGRTITNSPAFKSLKRREEMDSIQDRYYSWEPLHDLFDQYRNKIRPTDAIDFSVNFSDDVIELIEDAIISGCDDEYTTLDEFLADFKRYAELAEAEYGASTL